MQVLTKNFKEKTGNRGSAIDTELQAQKWYLPGLLTKPRTATVWTLLEVPESFWGRSQASRLSVERK